MPTPERFARNVVNRLLITAVDGFCGCVRAHFNPKEVTIDKKVNWTESKQKGDHGPFFEYTSGAPRTMTMELLFDRFEVKDQTVEIELQNLQRMAIPLDPKGKKEQRRPPFLKIENGPIEGFSCVLESLAVKVLMFNPQGRPVRATANVTFKELRLKDVQVEKPYLVSGTGDRDARNWQKANAEDIARAREQGRKDRERVEMLKNLE